MRFMGLILGSGKVKRARGGRRFEAVVEGLEGRRVLNASGATVFVANGQLEVIGTNLGDTASVSAHDGLYEVKVSNSQGSDDLAFPASQVQYLYFLGGNGTNTFTNATPLNTTMIGGAGDNTLTGGSGSDFLYAPGNGTEVLNAGPGFESLMATGSGTHTLNGGSGLDRMTVSAGTNHINGGSGFSVIIAYGGQNTIDGGTGTSYVLSFSATDVIIPRNQEYVIRIGY